MVNATIAYRQAHVKLLELLALVNSWLKTQGVVTPENTLSLRY